METCCENIESEMCFVDVVLSAPLAGFIPSGSECANSYSPFDDSDSDWGCTDPAACNYDSNADYDDGSCDYGTMCWDGSYECDASDCPDSGNTDNYLYISSLGDDGSGNVFITIGYSFADDIAGFDFDLLNVILVYEFTSSILS